MFRRKHDFYFVFRYYFLKKFKSETAAILRSYNQPKNLFKEAKPEASELILEIVL